MTDEIRASATEATTAGLYPFTASQWQELEQQTLAFKYIVSGMPVPPHLISTVIRSNFTSSSLFPYHQQQSPGNQQFPSFNCLFWVCFLAYHKLFF